jgi:hypothetical protein
MEWLRWRHRTRLQVGWRLLGRLSLVRGAGASRRLRLNRWICPMLSLAARSGRLVKDPTTYAPVTNFASRRA